MPYQDIPKDPNKLQDAPVPLTFPNRGWRQVVIVDIPFVLAVAYFLVGFGFFLKQHLSWSTGIISVALMLVFVTRLAYISRNFLIELFQPSSTEDLGERIRNRLWGWHQILFSKTILINKTILDPVDHWSKWLGGPANLVIYDGFAAYLEYGNRFRRVVGAGLPIPYLDTRETIKTIVDLRPQFREFEANAWTKDGIRVILGVRIESRIGSDYSPESADPKLLYPFDPLSVRNAVEYTAVREQNKELSEADWCEGAIGNIQALLAHHISRHRLDELYLTERGDGQILSAEMLKQLVEEANSGLKRAGVHISNIQITKTLIPEDVYGQRLDVWKAGKDSVVTRIQGQARAFEIRVGEEARARAQRDLIVSIIRSLDKIDPQHLPEATLLSLSKVLDRGLKDPSVRANMAKEPLSILENLDKLLP